jgi:hypothetical protein
MIIDAPLGSPRPLQWLLISHDSKSQTLSRRPNMLNHRGKNSKHIWLYLCVPVLRFLVGWMIWNVCIGAICLHGASNEAASTIGNYRQKVLNEMFETGVDAHIPTCIL